VAGVAPANTRKQALVALTITVTLTAEQTRRFEEAQAILGTTQAARVLRFATRAAEQAAASIVDTYLETSMACAAQRGGK